MSIEDKGGDDATATKIKTISLGKFGSFRVDALLGRPFGESYEIDEKGGLTVLKESGKLASVEDVGDEDDLTTEALQGRGDVIMASKDSQTLTPEELELLKATGEHSDIILDRLIESHLAFKLKNGYSKEKYVKKKEAKYRKRFTLLEPTIENVSLYLIEREHARVRELAPQVLGYMCSATNVRPGGRSLVVDDAHGILVAAVMHRLGDQGVVLALHDNDVPSHESIELFNFDQNTLATYHSLAWNVTEEGWTPTGYLVNGCESSSTIKPVRPKRRKKTASDKIYESREIFFEGAFENCLISTHFEPTQVIKRITPFLQGSATIAIHSPFLNPLAKASEVLRHSKDYINAHVHELFLREYQVLPGRCHPLMNMPGGSGYILTAIRVIPDENAYLNELKRKRDAYGRRQDVGGNV